jgi:hypothetical protein
LENISADSWLGRIWLKNFFVSPLSLAHCYNQWPLKLLQRCHDFQHNDTQHNDTEHNDTKHNYTQHSITQHNDIHWKSLKENLFVIEQYVLDTNAGKNSLKLSQMSNSHWCWKNELHLNVDLNFDPQMSLSKGKSWYSNNCLHFLKCAVPLKSFIRLSFDQRPATQNFRNHTFLSNLVI